MRTVFQVLAFMVLAAPALAGWQDDLVVDIEEEHGCEVAFLTQVVERVIDGRQFVMAKVHCRDGRAFDAKRTDEGDIFEFKECAPEPTVC
jgi:hypothetical protein